MRERLDVAGWTAGVGRSAASAVLNGALTGRVQLLTAGEFNQPFEAFTTDDMPAGIAFVHLAGPLSTRTTWSVEAATARGGVASWFVGGTYATRTSCAAARACSKVSATTTAMAW